jgi:hypothetical protein
MRRGFYNPSFSKTNLVDIILFIRTYGLKKLLEMALPLIISLYLASCLSIGLFMCGSLLFQISLELIHGLHPHVILDLSSTFPFG